MAPTGQMPLGPAEIAAAVRAQGYALLPSVLEPALVDELRADIDGARAREEARFGRDLLEEIGQDGYVSDLLEIGPSMARLLDHFAVHQAMGALLGDEARLFVGQAIALDPGKGRGIWPRCWHADMFQARQAIGDGTFCFGVNCLAVIDPMNDETGPTCLLPGSQGLAEMVADTPEAIGTREVRIEAPPGSLLLIDAGTWHSAGTNRSARSRRVLKLLFTRPWIRPQVDYAAASPKAFARLSARAQRYFRREAP